MFNSFTPGFIPMHNVLITQEFNLKLMSNQVHKFHCSFYSFTILAIQEWNVFHKGYYIVNLRKLDRDLKLFEWRFLHWGICPQTEIWCRWGVHTETRTQFMRFEVNGCAVWVQDTTYCVKSLYQLQLIYMSDIKSLVETLYHMTVSNPGIVKDLRFTVNTLCFGICMDIKSAQIL